MCREQNCHLERVEMISFSLLVLGLSAVCALPVTKVAENVTESSQKNGLVMSTNGKSYTKCSKITFFAFFYYFHAMLSKQNLIGICDLHCEFASPCLYF